MLVADITSSELAFAKAVRLCVGMRADYLLLCGQILGPAVMLLEEDGGGAFSVYRCEVTQEHGDLALSCEAGASYALSREQVGPAERAYASTGRYSRRITYNERRELLAEGTLLEELQEAAERMLVDWTWMQREYLPNTRVVMYPVSEHVRLEAEGLRTWSRLGVGETTSSNGITFHALDGSAPPDAPTGAPTVYLSHEPPVFLKDRSAMPMSPVRPMPMNLFCFYSGWYDYPKVAFLDDLPLFLPSTEAFSGILRATVVRVEFDGTQADVLTFRMVAL